MPSFIAVSRKSMFSDFFSADEFSLFLLFVEIRSGCNDSKSFTRSKSVNHVIF